MDLITMGGTMAGLLLLASIVFISVAILGLLVGLFFRVVIFICNFGR